MTNQGTTQRRTGRTIAAAAGTVALVAALGFGGYAFAQGFTPAPVTPAEEVEETPTPSPTPTETLTPTPTPEPEPVVEPPAPEPAPEPVGPVLCPPGSTSNGSDGYNDTSCYPNVCFTIVVPDPAHPECDAPFRP